MDYLTSDVQNPTNLVSSSVGHSSAGQEALNMKRGAIGSPPLSLGKKSPHRKADLYIDNHYSFRTKHLFLKETNSFSLYTRNLSWFRGPKNVVANLTTYFSVKNRKLKF